VARPNFGEFSEREATPRPHGTGSPGHPDDASPCSVTWVRVMREGVDVALPEEPSSDRLAGASFEEHDVGDDDDAPAAHVE
jgi:hypothetical protein